MTRKKGSYNWICAICETTMYIAETVYLKCANGRHEDQIIRWYLNCGKHGNHTANSFQPADYQGFAMAPSHAVQFMDKAGSTWVAQLIIELGKQYNRE